MRGWMHTRLALGLLVIVAQLVPGVGWAQAAIFPIRTPGQNAEGWNNTDVTVQFTCVDNRSALSRGSLSPFTRCQRVHHQRAPWRSLALAQLVYRSWQKKRRHGVVGNMFLGRRFAILAVRDPKLRRSGESDRVIAAAIRAGSSCSGQTHHRACAHPFEVTRVHRSISRDHDNNGTVPPPPRYPVDPERAGLVCCGRSWRR